MGKIIYSFDPIVDDKSRVLILGTMPGVESLRKQKYYGHPRNAFWPIIAAVCGRELPVSYVEKTAMLLDGGIALWDVCRGCEREGRPLAAIDAIALLESGLKELCHATVAVIAPPEVRVRRIMAREGISEDYAWARVRAQKPDDYFIKGCDYTLWNDCAGPEEFGARVRALLEKLFADKEV